MNAKINNAIAWALNKMSIMDLSFNIDHPEDYKNGHFSTNVAMVCAKSAGTSPIELARKIVSLLEEKNIDYVEKIEIAGAGFINFFLKPEFFVDSVAEINKEGENYGKNTMLNNSYVSNKKIMVEYTQPNPFKPFHIGHLMSNAIGESISRIVEFAGADVIRANYQGDVGPHVAKAIWAMMKKSENTFTAEIIGECYVDGATLYESDPNVKKEIDELNKKIYEKSDPEINKLYDLGRKVTLDAFEEIYKILGTKFDRYYFESEMAPRGVDIVRANTPKVFVESDGATVFHAEDYDPKLHTRVFITSSGLPTYETKELGLTKNKFDKEDLFLSIVTTAVEQRDYMRVLMQAIKVLYPELSDKLLHITHGMMRFADGKMSSRKGNVITGESLIMDAREKVREISGNKDLVDSDINAIAVAAIKYSILRSSTGSDIIYDFDKSISFEGDSGPYMQYSAVRAMSVLEKANGLNVGGGGKFLNTDLEKELYKFPEIVVNALTSFEPHHIATYLMKLSGAFNSFYGNEKIVDENDNNSAYKIELTKAYLQIMENGLWLLGIKIPSKM
jgi:arginyl-tRNA synthetase